MLQSKPEALLAGLSLRHNRLKLLRLLSVLVEDELNGIIVAVFFIDSSYVNEITGILDVDAAIISNNDVVASSIDASADLETLLQTRIDLNEEHQSFNVHL